MFPQKRERNQCYAKLNIACLALLASIAATPALAKTDEAEADQAAEQPTGAPPETHQDNGESLAKKLSNPIASLISVPFQANADFGVGLTEDGQKYTLNIQPVIPISISPAPI